MVPHGSLERADRRHGGRHRQSSQSRGVFAPAREVQDCCRVLARRDSALLKNGIMLAAAAALVVAAAPVRAQESTLSLTVQNGRFQPAELHAPANKAFVISIKNGDAKPVEFESVSL